MSFRQENYNTFILVEKSRQCDQEEMLNEREELNPYGLYWVYTNPAGTIHSSLQSSLCVQNHRRLLVPCLLISAIWTVLGAGHHWYYFWSHLICRVLTAPGQYLCGMNYKGELFTYFSNMCKFIIFFISIVCNYRYY